MRVLLARWKRKFAAAIAGLVVALRHQSSLQVHCVASVLVVLMAVLLDVEAWRWAVLLLAMGLVWSAELINTAVEMLVHKLHPEQDPDIGLALDAAAASVLVAAIASAAIGLVVLGPPLWAAVGG